MHWRLQKLLHHTRPFNFLVESSGQWDNAGVLPCLIERNHYRAICKMLTSHVSANHGAVIITSTLVTHSVDGCPKKQAKRLAIRANCRLRQSRCSNDLFPQKIVESALRKPSFGMRAGQRDLCYRCHMISCRTHRDSKQQEELNLNSILTFQQISDH